MKITFKGQTKECKYYKGLEWDKPLTAKMEEFKEETGKNPIYRGAITGQFEYWLYWRKESTKVDTPDSIQKPKPKKVKPEIIPKTPYQIIKQRQKREEEKIGRKTIIRPKLFDYDEDMKEIKKYMNKNDKTTKKIHDVKKGLNSKEKTVKIGRSIYHGRHELLDLLGSLYDERSRNNGKVGVHARRHNIKVIYWSDPKSKGKIYAIEGYTPKYIQTESEEYKLI